MSTLLILVFTVVVISIFIAWDGLRRLLSLLRSGDAKISKKKIGLLGATEVIVAFSLAGLTFLYAFSSTSSGPSFFTTKSAVEEYLLKADHNLEFTKFPISTPLADSSPESYDVSIRTNKGVHNLKVHFDANTKVISSITEIQP